MVFMRMREQHSIQCVIVDTQHLLPEVWRSINNNGSGRRLYQDAAAQAFILFIFGNAYFTVAANHGYASTGAGAKECYSEWWKQILINKIQGCKLMYYSFWAAAPF